MVSEMFIKGKDGNNIRMIYQGKAGAVSKTGGSNSGDIILNFLNLGKKRRFILCFTAH